MPKPLRILIVDDQPRARRSLKALLGIWMPSNEVSEAADGVEAVDRVKEFKPDLVFMDVKMPQLDGVEATRIIKTKSPQVTIVVLSLYAEYREKALLAGADSFVGKGDPPEQLYEILAGVASKKLD